MPGLSDTRDIVRGGGVSLFGFAGRLIARTLLLLIAGKVYGAEAIGVLGIFAAATEIGAAIATLGLKRGLLIMLSADAKTATPPQARVVEALCLGAVAGLLISAALTLIWRFALRDAWAIWPILFLAPLAIALTDIALAATRWRRVMWWEAASRAIVEPWSFVALATAFSFAGAGVNGLLAAYAGSTIAAFSVAAIGLMKTYGLRALWRSGAQISNWRAIAARGAPVAVTDLGNIALRRVDLIVMAAFVSPKWAGVYYMAQQLASIPQKTYPLFEPMLSPVVAQLHTHNERKKLRAIVAGVCRWVLIIQLAISVPMMVHGDRLLALFGPDFSTGAGVLAILLLAEAIDGAFSAAETPLVYARPSIPLGTLMATVAIEVAGIAALSSAFGAIGAATGFLIAIIFLANARLIMLYRQLHITVIDRDFIAPISIAAFVIAAAAAGRYFTEAPSIGVMALAIACAVAVFFALARFFAMTPSDHILLRALRRRRRKQFAAS